MMFIVRMIGTAILLGLSYRETGIYTALLLILLQADIFLQGHVVAVIIKALKGAKDDQSKIDK